VKNLLIFTAKLGLFIILLFFVWFLNQRPSSFLVKLILNRIIILQFHRPAFWSSKQVILSLGRL
jgi:hypothetical protein